MPEESSEILFSSSGRSGTHYEETAEAEGIENDSLLGPIEDYQVQLYMKVGTYFGWSWQEFIATPLPVIKELALEIDHRMEHIMEPGMYLDYNMLGVLIAVAKAFGGSKSSSE